MPFSLPEASSVTGSVTAVSGTPLIEARGLTKRFGEFTAVDGIDFTVERGETFGFLGPNGAGKTSTMRMIGAVSPVSGGTLRALGLDPGVDGPAIKARMGVVPQQDTLDFELTVYENLLVYGRYFGLPKDVIKSRAEELLEFVQLQERRESKVEPLSGGMKRRLTIARGLINDPELLLLDEPTTGLDPQARHVLWDRLYRLKQQGVTQVLTTHYMDEAEQLCDRIAVVDGGRVVASDTPQGLIARFGGPIKITFTPDGHDVRFLEDVAHVHAVRRRGDRIEAEGTGPVLALVAAELVARGLVPADLRVEQPTLEDVFLRLTDEQAHHREVAR
jgi:lipooligosaccharide transport system ATP-binding protein